MTIPSVVLLYPGRGRVPAPPSPPQILFPPTYLPETIFVPGNIAGSYAGTPDGCILHGTRSNTQLAPTAEFWGTINYVRAGAGGLGWTVTIGPDIVAEHMNVAYWGWNARAASSKRLACEFAQSGKGDRHIEDGQVRAFCWWWVHRVLPRWPSIKLNLPTHAEVEEWGQTGVDDGKTDTFAFDDPQATALRARIVARLTVLGIAVQARA